MRTLAAALALASAFPLVACSTEDGGAPGGTASASYSVSGRVIDFITADDVAATTVATTGLSDETVITMDGARFTILGVPANSSFTARAAGAGYHATIAAPIDLADHDVRGVFLPAVSDATLSALSQSLGIALDPSQGILFAHVVDARGQSLAHVGSAQLRPSSADFAGPFFLDENLVPDTSLTETTASGWVVYLALDPGHISLEAPPGSNVSVIMPSSPVQADTVSVARVEVRDGLQ